MILLEKQPYMPVNVGMRRINGDVKMPEYRNTKTNKTPKSRYSYNSIVSHRISNQHPSTLRRRSVDSSFETWKILDNQNINSNTEHNGLTLKRDSKIFPQIRIQSRSKSSGNLLEIVKPEKRSSTYGNSGFLTERRSSQQSVGRSVNTPRGAKTNRSISSISNRNSKTVPSNLSTFQRTPSLKSLQSFNGSNKDKNNNSQQNGSLSRPLSRDSIAANRSQNSENIISSKNNTSHKVKSNGNWAHSIRDENKSPTPLNIATRSINHLMQPDKFSLLLKPRSSSVRSPSSNDSTSGASYNIKYSGRRRLSLPTPSGPLLAPLSMGLGNESGKSPEYSKAFEDLRGNVKNISNDHSIETVLRAQTSSPSNRRDSLQRIEEIPGETAPKRSRNPSANSRHCISIPIVEEPPILNDKPKNKSESSNSNSKTQPKENHNIELNGTNYPHLREPSDSPKKSLFHFDAEDIKRRNSSHLKKEEEISNREKNIFMVHGYSGEFSDKSSENDDQNWLNKHNITLEEALNNLATERFKENILWRNTASENSSSIIDISIVNQDDDTMEDENFRKKRMILWLMSVETGSNAESNLESKIISISPPCGSRATAINVVYDEK